MAIETESIANEPAAGIDGTPIQSAAVPFAGESEQAAKEAEKAADDAKAVEAAKDAVKAALEEEAKPEKTEAERERARMQRGIDRKTKAAAEARAENAQLRERLAQFERGQLTREPKGADNQRDQDDSEPLSLTRAELAQIVKAEAEKLAPTLSQQAAEAQRRQSVIQSFEAKLGVEKFNEVASDLDDAFGGLRDVDGKPKAATDAVFEADDPVAVATWLADPDNHVEAERISKLSATQAGKAIAKLELRFDADAKADAAAKAAEKAKAKPIPSKAPAPLESVRGQGSVSNAPDPSDTKAWMAWRNAQTRKGL